MALAKRQVNPSRSSIALRRMAPPSELACGWSNFAMIGFEIPWNLRALCAIQAVVHEPFRVFGVSRVFQPPFPHLTAPVGPILPLLNPHPGLVLAEGRAPHINPP